MFFKKTFHAFTAAILVVYLIKSAQAGKTIQFGEETTWEDVTNKAPPETMTEAYGNQIVSLPAWLEKLPNLKRFYIHYAPRLAPLPESLDALGYFRKLTHLEIHNTALTTLPEYIGELHTLESLSLAHNQFAALPESLGNLANLQTFHFTQPFDGPKRVATLPPSIGNLQNLLSLSLKDNKIYALPPSIGNLGNLQTLLLQGTQLIELPEAIGNLGNLSHLYIENNPIALLPRSMGRLGNLSYLKISKVRMKPEVLSLFLSSIAGDLDQLGVLDLSGNALREWPAYTIHLKALSTLTLNDNKLSTVPEFIGQLRKLAYLNLERNIIRELPRSIIASHLHGALVSLSLRDNPLTIYGEGTNVGSRELRAYLGDSFVYNENAGRYAPHSLEDGLRWTKRQDPGHNLDKLKATRIAAKPKLDHPPHIIDTHWARALEELKGRFTPERPPSLSEELFAFMNQSQVILDKATNFIRSVTQYTLYPGAPASFEAQNLLAHVFLKLDPLRPEERLPYLATMVKSFVTFPQGAFETLDDMWHQLNAQEILVIDQPKGFFGFVEATYAHFKQKMFRHTFMPMPEKDIPALNYWTEKLGFRLGISATITRNHDQGPLESDFFEGSEGVALLAFFQKFTRDALVGHVAERINDIDKTHSTLKEAATYCLGQGLVRENTNPDEDGGYNLDDMRTFFDFQELDEFGDPIIKGIKLEGAEKLLIHMGFLEKKEPRQNSFAAYERNRAQRAQGGATKN